MAFFAISDLHLSFADHKPMDVFGVEWTAHAERIAANWDRVVSPEDTVLVGGDVSWALKLAQAAPDLEYLAARPGRKLLIRGNHDYWWGREATNKIQRLVDPSMILLQGKCTVVDRVGIAGTRGWRLEDYDLEGPVERDTKIYQRELAYLRRALESLSEDVETRVVMLHYPPFDMSLQPNEFRVLLDEFRVDILVYGHVHKGIGGYLEGDINGIRYYLASVDHTDFSPVRIL